MKFFFKVVFKWFIHFSSYSYHLVRFTKIYHFYTHTHTHTHTHIYIYIYIYIYIEGSYLPSNGNSPESGRVEIPPLALLISTEQFHFMFVLGSSGENVYKHIHTHPPTHTHIYIYIYIYKVGDRSQG